MIFPRQIIERHTSSSLFSGLNKIFFNLPAESSPFLSPILKNVNTTRSKHWHNSKSWLQIGCSKISDLSIRLFFKRHRKSCHIPLHQSSFHQTHFKASPGSHIGVSHVLLHELSSNVPQVTCQLSNMSQASSFSQFSHLSCQVVFLQVLDIWHFKTVRLMMTMVQVHSLPTIFGPSKRNHEFAK